MLKAVQGSVGGGDTWGTRERRRGAPITKIKNILWEIGLERTNGDGE